MSSLSSASPLKASGSGFASSVGTSTPTSITTLQSEEKKRFHNSSSQLVLIATKVDLNIWNIIRKSQVKSAKNKKSLIVKRPADSSCNAFTGADADLVLPNWIGETMFMNINSRRLQLLTLPTPHLHPNPHEGNFCSVKPSTDGNFFCLFFFFPPRRSNSA